MDSMRSLIKQLGKILGQKIWTLAIAESCTGGMLGDMITGLPGCSKFFLGGVIAYSNQAKSTLLNVSTESLEKYGAVSPEVALAMARGIRDIMGSSVGAAVTGIAGPGGGGKEKPVGLIYISVLTPELEVVKRFSLAGSRREIKTQAAETAIKLLIRVLQETISGAE